MIHSPAHGWDTLIGHPPREDGFFIGRDFPEQSFDAIRGASYNLSRVMYGNDIRTESRIVRGGSRVVNQAKRGSALFAGLVYDEAGNPVEVTSVGGTPCYVVTDGEFRRHIDSEAVDRQVLEAFREQIFSHREIVTAKMMEMLGKDDIFTKAMIDASFENMDRLLEYGLPEDARNLLGMMGFRVVINVHGEVVEIKAPEQPMPRDE